MRSQLIVGFVVEAPYSRVLDCSVHSLDLTIGPRVVGLGQAVLYPVCFADHVETHWPGIDGVAIPGLLCELNAVVTDDLARAPPLSDDRVQSPHDPGARQRRVGDVSGIPA